MVIKLSVRSSGSSRRESPRDEPVTVGVPFPRGMVVDHEALQLRDSRGVAQPLQRRVLDRWADGSARWILLDFRASTSAGAAEYELLTDAARAPHRGVRVEATETPNAVTINTGVLEARLS